MKIRLEIPLSLIALLLGYVSCAHGPSQENAPPLTTLPKTENISPVPITPPLAQAQALPGSLWTHDAPWNDLFETTKTRLHGDVIRLNSEKNFITKVIEKINETLTKQNEEEKTKQDALLAKTSGQAPIPLSPLSSSSDVTQVNPTSPSSPSMPPVPQWLPYAMAKPTDLNLSFLEATIYEEDRGVYEVFLSQKIDGPVSFTLFLSGKINDRDISADDSASTDNILQLNFDVKEVRGIRELPPSPPPSAAIATPPSLSKSSSLNPKTAPQGEKVDVKKNGVKT